MTNPATVHLPTVHLPTYHTSLVGRTTDVIALTSHLQDPATRLLTLVGASGSGKTRLALEVATGLASAFADGVVFVALAPVQDARFVIPTVAAALGVKEQGGTAIHESLAAHLATRQMLLILDNVEQVLDAAPELSGLIAGAPRLTLLLTSQAPLDLAKETTYPVPPLVVPNSDAGPNVEALLAYPGIALFVERMRQVQPRFRLSPANASAVVRISQLLDGYPLAIELIAAHSATLAPRDLLLLLRNHLGMLPHQASPAASSRAAILNPVLEWCTGRLPSLGQQLMLRLGVFLGDWTTEAAQAVLAPEHDLESVAEALALLAQKHLVQLETLPGQEPRYVALDAIREYSLGRLSRQHRAVGVQQRHAEYFEALAAAAEGPLRGGDQSHWLRQLDAEIHNLRAAVQWRIDQRQPVPALMLVSAVYLYWNMRTRLRRIMLDAYVQQHWPIKQALVLRQQDGLKNTPSIHIRCCS